MSQITFEYLRCTICFTLILSAPCTADLTVGDLTAGILDEITDILNGVLTITGQCPPPQPTQVDILLYTRSNPDEPTVLNKSNPNQIDPNKPVIALIHGWLSSPNASGIVKMRTAYLQRYDCNLVVVNWSQIAAQLYTTCYCVLPQIADTVADFFCTLVQQLNINLNTVHIVGHSLGAHMAGFVGNYTVNKCGQQIDRISGLDPAGPGYQNLYSDKRLDKSDAVFVDGVHTNEGVFGYEGNCGHVDFHVNCGTIQPGCSSFDINDLANTLESIVGCAHSRSMELMAESVATDQFIAKSCTGCPLTCLTMDIFNAKYIVMGEDCPRNSIKNNFKIPTKSSSPYAAGCTLYPGGCI
ncbi:hypothetical protein ILUMI_22459 [Ignelater luminosus]|uniref:Lipase domain-containing protein n=1 Tax=Ignelater luminosus TaxID=2038154 RepID=A0A8K0G2T1_IGNLU|nr:hypothetical protein ILUMI_22459 [Ignelater luminosus]